MAIIRKNEMKQMSEQTAISRLEELHKEMLKINAQRATHTPPENPGRVKAIRRTMAKLYTFLNRPNKQGVKTEDVKEKKIQDKKQIEGGKKKKT